MGVSVERASVKFGMWEMMWCGDVYNDGSGTVLVCVCVVCVWGGGQEVTVKGRCV